MPTSGGDKMAEIKTGIREELGLATIFFRPGDLRTHLNPEHIQNVLNGCAIQGLIVDYDTAKIGSGLVSIRFNPMLDACNPDRAIKKVTEIINSATEGA